MIIGSPICQNGAQPTSSHPAHLTQAPQGTRKCGERVKAVAQGYGGWVRVAPEEGGGWMLTLWPYQNDWILGGRFRVMFLKLDVVPLLEDLEGFVFGAGFILGNGHGVSFPDGSGHQSKSSEPGHSG